MFFIKINNKDGGLGIGDWGLGIGPNPQSPNSELNKKIIFLILKLQIIFYKN
jgi:hypothetical protein